MKVTARLALSIVGVRVLSVRVGHGARLTNPADFPAKVREYLLLPDAPPAKRNITPLPKDEFYALASNNDLKVTRRRGFVYVTFTVDMPRPRRVNRRKLRAEAKARGARLIETMADLCDHFDADEPAGLNRRIYKDTECGASLSVYLPDGTAVHNGSAKWRELTRETPIRGFTLQTIVEGSDATVDSDEFVLPVASDEVDHFIRDMEAQAGDLWCEANDEHSDVLHV